MAGERVCRRVNGPVLEVEGLASAMLDVIQVGAEKLPGEVIRLDGGGATVQVTHTPED